MIRLVPHSKVQRMEKDVLVTPLDDTYVMLHIEKSKYYNLNNVSSDIWQQLECPIAVSQIITTLCEKYDCSQEQCSEDTLKFLQQLYKQDLLKIL
ncbi:MAG: hypothetical protein QG673_286 [Pseudomonadota bacterium]|nr:hypothetical protein [Pseudomonadota bacterium]